MRVVFALCAGLLAVGLPGTIWAAEVNYSAAYNKCIDTSGGGDMAMVECITEEHARWDKMLNDDYRKLMGSLDADAKAALKDAQKAWLAFREKECQFAYVSNGGGTLSRMAANDCMMQMTAERATALRALIGQ